MKLKKTLLLSLAGALLFQFEMQTLLAQNENVPVFKSDETEENSEEYLGEIFVTGKKEKETMLESTQSGSVVTGTEIEEISPNHPMELIKRVPGAVLSKAGSGEGHMTGIRQPITTNPVYLFLEDGIPIRSTGFFNHNALYEVNIPQAERLEVLKGPGTSLYGSDAIGGVINSFTKAPPKSADASVKIEEGSWDFSRTLLSVGNTYGDHGFRLDLNHTDNKGWRNDSDYQRTSGTLRHDFAISPSLKLKTVFTHTNIDTASPSSNTNYDFYNDPRVNTMPMARRYVKAYRLSFDFEKKMENITINVTPYFRYNTLDLLPTWQLNFDPQIWSREHSTYGLNAKVSIEGKLVDIVTGIDLDNSPGSVVDHKIESTKEVKTDHKGITRTFFTSFEKTDKVYDYDVTFQGISPYVHSDWKLSNQLKVNAGLRYDVLSYDYKNKLGELTTGRHKRPGSTKKEWSNLSKKAGVNYLFTKNVSGFLSYREAFRIPSQSNLFKQGSADNTVDLDPVKAKSYEVGTRWESKSFDTSLTVYKMDKEDDIISFQDKDTGTRVSQNVGDTKHSGVELGVNYRYNNLIQFGVAGSSSVHKYVSWKSRAGASFDDNDIEHAPKTTGSSYVTYRPSLLNGGGVTVESEHIGKYWMDPENTTKYAGHDLLHLKSSYFVDGFDSLEVTFKVDNVLNKRYSSGRASFNGRSESYSPGEPTAYYVGIAISSI